MNQIITFAGVPGCGKTPVATYLSWKLNLPIFNKDAIRSEVKEDLLGKGSWIEEHDKRTEMRLKELMATGRTFILDSSVDRSWPKVIEYAKDQDYKVFVISFNLGEKFLDKILKTKDNAYGVDIDRGYFKQHQDFVDKFSSVINITIDDSNYHDRLELALQHVQSWLTPQT